ncbi:hypothetical protein NC651_022567 [Populus alba x Populus x berolinensis]|nr:hypothetical protein NC651_022567 [Populus alba x Populus x berolinensis]
MPQKSCNTGLLSHCSSSKRTAETNRNQRIDYIADSTTMKRMILTKLAINLCTK